MVAKLAFCPIIAMIAASIRIAIEPPFVDTLRTATEAVASRTREAEPQVRRLLSRNPDSPEGSWLLGNVYAGRGDHLGAFACFRRIPNSHPNGAQARLAEGDQIFEVGDAEAAEKAWTIARSEPTKCLDADQRLLALYGIQLRRDEWSRSLWSLIHSRPATLRELVQLMIMDHIVWQGEGAVETLQKFVAVNPIDRRSRASLVIHLLATGRPIEAKEHLDLLLKGPPNSSSQALAAMAYAVAENDPTVIEPFITAGEEKRHLELQANPSWSRGLGEIELLRGSPSTALPLLLGAARRDPFHPTGRQKLSLAFRLLGRTKEAELHASAANILARLDRNARPGQTAGAWTADEVQRVVHDAAAIGMVEEAKAWVHFAMTQQPSDVRWKREKDHLEAKPPTSRNNPPADFPDAAQELRRW